jgi:hypothetical protein
MAAELTDYIAALDEPAHSVVAAWRTRAVDFVT